MGIAIAVFLFLALIGGMGFAVYKTLQKTDPKKMDTSTVNDISTAQEFLPFDDIKDGMIILGGHKYRAVIECSSTTYNLKTGKEKEMIEISFQRFVNSLTFPITFFIQTKTIDNSKMIEQLEGELTETLKEYTQLEEYANVYFDEMNNLNSYIGNNKQKKKYIIVPYEDAINLGNLSNSEKYDYSSKELYHRASIIVEGLSTMGVKAQILDTKELAELVYSTYHKDNYSQVENLINGEYFTLLTEGENNKIENLSSDAKLDWILYEAQMRLSNELMVDNVPDFIKKNVEKSIQEIDRLRDSTSGYFKDKSSEFQSLDGVNSNVENIEFKKNVKINKVGGI